MRREPPKAGRSYPAAPNRAGKRALLACAVLALASCGAEPEPKPLDWSATWRWVHVDNVDAAKAALFENARLEWLRALRKSDRWLDDGRPVFWHARSGTVQTFFTFHPFGVYADLDARRDRSRRTNEAAGREAVDAYNAGDDALVAPHYSELWRRDPDDDVVPPAAAGLDESTAGAGRLEFLEPDLQKERRLGELWKTVKKELESRGYPLACRAFDSAFGSGDIVRFWLAPDAATLSSAPSIAAVMSQAIGAEGGRALVAEMESLVRVRSTLVVERRPDLSNVKPR